jgi:hypothetical protein
MIPPEGRPIGGRGKISPVFLLASYEIKMRNISQKVGRADDTIRKIGAAESR